MAADRGDEASGDVVAEQHDARGIAAIAHRQSAAGVGAVRRISERRLCTEGDVRQINALPREGLRATGHDAAAVNASRIGDLDAAADAGGDVEVAGRVVADQHMLATSWPPLDTDSVPLPLAGV